MSKTTFIAFLYVIGVAFTGLGLVDLYYKVRFMGAQSGVMTTTDPAVARAAKYSPGDGTYAEVFYTTAKGKVHVPRAFLNADLVKRLADGESIPVKFTGNRPSGGFYDGKEPETNLGWFVIGLIALATAIYAHRLLRKESEED